MLTEGVVRWLESRSLDPEKAAALGWAGSKDRDGGDELVIPYLVGGQAVNHKYRAIEGKRFRQDAEATKCFWNFDAICDPTLASEPLIVTEGEIDALALVQCGYARTVSVPDGAPARSIESDRESRKYDYLEHARHALRGAKEIILATDGDQPGIALLNDLSIRLGKARCKWVQYPYRDQSKAERCKDLAEVLERHGEKAVHEVIRRAQWCKVDGVYRMSELPPYPRREQFQTFDFLSDHYRMRMGDFCVVTGIPGDGKTVWVNDLCCRAADEHGWTIAIASFEQHPQADHRRVLREWYLRKPERHMAASEVEQADAWIDRHFVFIVPDDDDLANLEWALDKAAAAVIRYGARVVVIDPWNEIDHDRPSDMSLTEYTGKAIKEFKRLARSLDVHLIVVAHPTKLPSGDMPSLYSISDSAAWANKADIGIVIWRKDRESTRTLCRIAKSRYHDQIGKPGKVWMSYSEWQRRFSEAIDEAAERAA